MENARDMKDVKYIEDHFYFCSEILRNQGKEQLNVALEEIEGVDIVYKSSSTPYYLQKLGVIEFIATDIYTSNQKDLLSSSGVQWLMRGKKITAKGLFVITFDLKKVKEYMARMITKIPGIESDSIEQVEYSLKGHCEEKGEVGYLIFDKPKEEFEVGNVKFDQYRLLKEMEPFGVWHTIETVFNSLDRSVESESYASYNPEKIKAKQRKILKNIIGEIQRTGKLRGRVGFKFSKDNKKVICFLKQKS